MKPETTGLDLIAAVEQTLAREVAPTLHGDARFKTLMAASALRMVMRELTGADQLAAASATLGGFGSPEAQLGAIRGGKHDADDALHIALMVDATTRVQVSNPARVVAGAANKPVAP
jgi:hypothetical protein